MSGRRGVRLMERAEGQHYGYAIDAADRLVSVDGAWLEFARENAAPELTEEKVLGRSIWSFIEGDETRELYERLFASVREDGRERRVPFRCDSPTVYRFMELRLSPADRSGIDLCGVLLREQVRVYCPFLDSELKRAMYSFLFCGVCNRVFAYGAWMELDDAIRRLDAFETNEPPALERSVCDDCRTVVGDAASPVAP